MAPKKWFTEDWYGMGFGATFSVTRKLLTRITPFQKIEIYESVACGKLAVFDNCVMLTERFHHFYHEMLVHPLLTPRMRATQVAIIGGGDCGVLAEVLKHPHVTHVDQVEIDRIVTEVSKTFFPQLCATNHDPRTRFYFTDGIAWMKDTSEGRYDVIIVDSTDPVGMAAGLSGRDFYADCFRALRREGALVVQTGSPIFHRAHSHDVRASLRQTGLSDLETMTFPQPDYPSGIWSATVATKGGCLVRALPRSTKMPSANYYSERVHAGALLFPSFAF